ncbi:hypothetical protein JZ751_010956 [Albula glossodonta]|uniref:Uncharacterized protein n=1 Tax=Albula glossodonta TaxID=121402 RepID=A0A8T2P6K4_9TELE|nr:hypothetical protein JZ751_010956 [Albula glossodonta]
MEKRISAAEARQPPHLLSVPTVSESPQHDGDHSHNGKAVGFVLAVEKLKAGAMAVEAVTAALVELEENDSGSLDTVGAIVVDQEGNVAAAVSSGGLAMKHPGRVGQVIASSLTPYRGMFKSRLEDFLDTQKTVGCPLRVWLLG